MPVTSRSLLKFGPFKGYTSAVEPFIPGPDYLVGALDGSCNQSVDCLINPFTGDVTRRAGASIVGDTVSGVDEVTGILESKWSARCRKLGGFSSRSFSNDAKTVSAKYTNERNTSFPTSDIGFQGVHYVRSTNAVTSAQANYVLGKEFGATHYPGSAGLSTSPNWKCIPLWHESGEGGLTRGAFEFGRRFFGGGSRGWLDAGSYRYDPALRGTPFRWNKRFNELTGSGTEPNRVFPMGAWAPLCEPGVAKGTTATGADANWNDGDFFYFSVIFQFEDGSYSLPMIPRPISGTLTTGFLAVTVGTAGGSTKYQDLQWTHVPIGPDGTVARFLCRTNKMTWTSVAKNDQITIGIGDLKICGVLHNNTQTVYTDTNGNDAGLLDDPNVIRFDLTLPRRARYIWTGDQRALIGYTLPNPCALMIAPVSSNSSDYDLNVADDSSPGATGFFVRITSAQLELHYNAGAGPDFTAVTGNAKAFLFATYTTLQSLCDAVNATSRTGTPECKGWRAALAPGADGTLASTSLVPTQYTSAASLATHSNTTLDGFDAATLAAIAVGMYVTGTDISAGTYVVSKSSTGVVLSAAATGSHASLTMKFWNNTGDDGTVTGGTVGYVRAYCPALPVVLYLKRSAMQGYERPDKSSIYFTISSPGAASTGVSLAPNAWGAANRRQVPAYLGMCVGGVDIENAAVCAFTDGMRLFINQRGVTSGEDFDYRLLTINEHRGCCASDSLVAAHGWATYATRDGIMATDKTRAEYCISGPVFNAATRQGDMALEIGKCLTSADADGDNEGLHAAIFGNKIALTMRTKASLGAVFPTATFTYDFSQGIEASGLAGLVNLRTGEPWLWNPPALFNSSTSRQAGPGVLCAIPSQTADLVFYGATDSNTGATGDGRIDQLYTGSTDNGTAVTCMAALAITTSEHLHNFRALRLSVVHYSPNGSATLSFAATNVNNTGDSETVTLASVISALGKFYQQTVKIRTKQAALADAIQITWFDSAATPGNKLYEIAADMESVPE